MEEAKHRLHGLGHGSSENLPGLFNVGSGCGVIITTSHNPKEYNGFKAYNDRGGQVVDPWDVEVEAQMAALPVVPVPPVAPEGRILPIPADIESAYLALGQGLLQHPKAFTAARILYTPFHGTGIAFVPALFEQAGLPLSISPSQGIQDGTFPTAPRPNPEELAAYAAPIREANEIEAEIILSNDPDADRIGVVARRNGAWELMTGNDIAGLTLDYLCSQKGRKGAVVSTVVTSDFMAEVARHYGLPVVWTLTGFKNIAVCMDRLEALGEPYAFSAEESYGMLIPPSLRDKDGVTAALVVAEMAGHYTALGMTLIVAVQALMAKVGTFHNRLVNLEDPRPGGAKRFAEAMGRIREAGLATLGGEKVVSWEDFETGLWHGEGRTETILDRPDQRSVALPMLHSNALKFRLESGAFAAFRPSGTEPKLKVYLQSRSDIALLDRLEAEARSLLGL